MYYPPPWQDVLPTQLQISLCTKRNHWIVATSNAHILLYLPKEECLHTLFQYWFSDKVITKSRKMFKMGKEQSIFFREPEEWSENSAWRQRDSQVKSAENCYWTPSKRQNQRILVDQFLWKESNKLKRLNFGWNGYKIM